MGAPLHRQLELAASRLINDCRTLALSQSSLLYSVRGRVTYTVFFFQPLMGGAMHTMVKHHTEYGTPTLVLTGLSYTWHRLREHLLRKKLLLRLLRCIRTRSDRSYRLSYRLYISLYMEEWRRVHRPRAFHVYRKPLVVSSRCWWCWCSHIPIY